jgi:hypothetical protein
MSNLFRENALPIMVGCIDKCINHSSVLVEKVLSRAIMLVTIPILLLIGALDGIGGIVMAPVALLSCGKIISPSACVKNALDGFLVTAITILTLVKALWTLEG